MKLTPNQFSKTSVLQDTTTRNNKIWSFEEQLYLNRDSMININSKWMANTKSNTKHTSVQIQ